MLDTPIWNAERIETLLASITPQTADQAQHPAAEPPAPAATKPPPPPQPQATPARKAPLQPPWPHLALEPQPGDPPDDLTRLGRGFAAPKLNAQTFPDPSPDPRPSPSNGHHKP